MSLESEFLLSVPKSIPKSIDKLFAVVMNVLQNSANDVSDLAQVHEVWIDAGLAELSQSGRG